MLVSNTVFNDNIMAEPEFEYMGVKYLFSPPMPPLTYSDLDLNKNKFEIIQKIGQVKHRENEIKYSCFDCISSAIEFANKVECINIICDTLGAPYKVIYRDKKEEKSNIIEIF